MIVPDLTSLPPLPTEPRVSVVVPARDAAATLPDAVRSVLRQHVGDLEVVIAVGPSEDGTRQVAEQLAAADPRVRVVDNPAGTTPVGLNLAIAATSGAVVARLDAHAELPGGYLSRAVSLLRATGAVNVGGRQVPVAEDGFAAAVARAMASPLGAGGAAHRTGTEAGDVDTVYLGVFRRDALEAVGGYDERLLRNQDYELNHRLRVSGGNVHFHPDLAVRYRPRSSPRELWRQYHEYGAWKRRVLQLHPGSVRLRQLVPPLFVLALVAGAVLGLLGWWLPAALLVAVYAAAVLVGGAVASRDRPSLAVRTAFVLTVLHVAWGVGFLLGRADRRRDPVSDRPTRPGDVGARRGD